MCLRCAGFMGVWSGTSSLAGLCGAQYVVYRASAITSASLLSIVGHVWVQHIWEWKQWATLSPAGLGGWKQLKTVAHTSAQCVTLQGWPPRLGTHHAWVTKAMCECSTLKNVRDELHWALWDLKHEGRSLFFFFLVVKVVNTGNI